MIELINNNINLGEIDLYELLISYIELHFNTYYFLSEHNINNSQIKNCFSLIRIIYLYILSLTNNINLSEFISFKFSIFYLEIIQVSKIFEIPINSSEINEIILLNYMNFFTNHSNKLPKSIFNILDFINYFLTILIFNFSEPNYNSKELSIFIINIIKFKNYYNLLFDCLSKINTLKNNPNFKPIWIYQLFNLKFSSLSKFLNKNYSLDTSLTLLDNIWDETLNTFN
jgi:hypothetical protein